MLKAQSEEDEVAMTNLLGEKKDFLEKALHNYILCLQCGVRAYHVSSYNDDNIRMRMT